MFKIYNNDAMVNGTSLQGHIEATYDDGEGDKVHTEWALEFQNEEGDYITATIYDWKEENPYTSRSGKYRWHIGGNSYEAVEAVYDYAREVA